MDRRNFIKKTLTVTVGGVLISSPIGIAETIGRGNINHLFNKEGNKMKIVVLTGSPRRNGNSSYLADRFIKGATEAGHQIYRFDTAFKEVHPCIACNKCGMNGPCSFTDDFTVLRPHLIEADMVVFVSPMYYFGFSAQLKSVIDRFYAINGIINGAPKKTAFLMTYANTSHKDAEAMIAHYTTIANYMGWKDCGMVIAPGVWTAGSIKNTHYGEDAYQLGKSL